MKKISFRNLTVLIAVLAHANGSNVIFYPKERKEKISCAKYDSVWHATQKNILRLNSSVRNRNFSHCKREEGTIIIRTLFGMNKKERKLRKRINYEICFSLFLSLFLFSARKICANIIYHLLSSYIAIGVQCAFRCGSTA